MNKNRIVIDQPRNKISSCGITWVKGGGGFSCLQRHGRAQWSLSPSETRLFVKQSWKTSTNNSNYDFYFSLLWQPPAMLDRVIDFPENTTQFRHIDSLRKQNTFCWETVYFLCSSCDFTLLQFIHFCTRPFRSKWTQNVEAMSVCFMSARLISKTTRRI